MLRKLGEQNHCPPFRATRQVLTHPTRSRNSGVCRGEARCSKTAKDSLETLKEPPSYPCTHTHADMHNSSTPLERTCPSPGRGVLAGTAIRQGGWAGHPKISPGRRGGGVPTPRPSPPLGTSIWIYASSTTWGSCGS